MVSSRTFFIRKLSACPIWALALTVTMTSQLMAAADPDVKAVEYVAIGDSIPFGDNSYIPKTAEARPDQTAFVGYPELLAQNLYQGQVTNLACPGETSSGLIALEAISPTCQNYRSKVGLKVAYSGTQLDALLELVRAHPEMKLITLSIGGNDFFQVQGQCIAENPRDPVAINACLQARIPGAIYGLYLNVASLWQQVKAAGFTGKLIYANNYSLNFQDPLLTQIAYSANAVMQSVAEVEGATVADVFTAIAGKVQPFGGDNCQTGLFIPNPNQPVPAGASVCDYHPSFEGAQLIAATIEDVLKK